MGLTDRERRVCQCIADRADQLLADLRLHVGLPTGGGRAASLDLTRQLLTQRARDLGAAVELIPGDPAPDWLYGRVRTDAPPPPTAICRRLTTTGRPILIAGHLDTVHDPEGPFRDLVISPDGRRAVGPGCVDMKGGLVIAVAALECLDACDERLSWTLLLNSDEETGSYHSQRAIYDEAARIAAAHGIGVALEPAGAGGELIVERAGSGQFCIHVHGRAAHVGRDFAAGVSAVTSLARLIVKLASLSRPEAQTIVNVGPIEGGHATNVVPDHARAWGNVRFPTPEAAVALEAQLRGICNTEMAAVAGLRIEVFASFIRAAKPATDQVMQLAHLARQTFEDLGQQLPFGKTAGVCDGNIMQAAGLPTLDTLGVRGGGLHTTDEWIDLPSLVERCQALAVFLLRAGQQSRT